MIILFEGCLYKAAFLIAFSLSADCQFPFSVNTFPNRYSGVQQVHSFLHTNLSAHTKTIQMIRGLFFISMLIISAYSLRAQKVEEEKGGIRGTVTTSDHQPAAAVTVQLKGRRKTTVTDDR